MMLIVVVLWVQVRRLMYWQRRKQEVEDGQ